MQTTLGWIARAPAGMLFVLCVGLVMVGLAVLADWSRMRRRETTDLQIALTGAIHARYGSIAAPIARNPFWGRRQIRLAVRPGAASKARVAAHEVFAAADRTGLGRYEIVLTPAPAIGHAAQALSAYGVVRDRAPDTKAAA